MLNQLFFRVLEMSSAGSIVILAVLAARLLLKRSPKVYSYLLWLVVLFRLLCPVTLEAEWGSVPTVEVGEDYEWAEREVSFGQSALAAYEAVEDLFGDGIDIQYVRDADGIAFPFLGWEALLLFSRYLWLAGLAAMALWGLFSLWKLKRRLTGWVELEPGVLLADGAETAFVLGLVRPRIYLPSTLPAGRRELILRHERYHIRRGDPAVKLLAFAALCLHWFNPLVWLAFHLLERDMEMSCDEGVTRNWNKAVRAEYSELLLELSTGRPLRPGMPLAFGEGDIGSRIRNLLKARELKRWQAALLLLAVAGLGLFLGTDRIRQGEALLGTRYAVSEILWENPSMSFVLHKEAAPYYTVTADYSLWEQPRGSGESTVMPMEKVHYSRTELYALFPELKNNVHERLDRVKLIYRGGSPRGDGNFSLLMQGSRGEVWLIRGFTGTDGREWARWLFELDPIATTPGDWDYIERSVEHEIGAQAELFVIGGVGTQRSDEQYLVAGFYSDGASYHSDVGFAVIRNVGRHQDWTFQIVDCHVYPGMARTGNGFWIMSDPAVLHERKELRPADTYDVVLISNRSVATVTRTILRGDEVVRTEEYPTHGQPAALLFPWEELETGESAALHFYTERGEELTPP